MKKYFLDEDALQLVIDLAIMHHSDSGYAQKRMSVLQAARAALAAAVAKKDAETALQEVSDFGQMQELLAERDALKAENERLRAEVSAHVMVNTTPPATARDRWMYEQGRLAERDPRTHTTPAAMKGQS